MAWILVGFSKNIYFFVLVLLGLNYTSGSSSPKVICQLACRRCISSEEETEEILVENVLWEENAEATLGHRAEPRQLEAGGAARGGGAVQEGD